MQTVRRHGWRWLLLIVIVLFFGGFGVFLLSLPRTPPAGSVNADAIIALTGGGGRLEAAVDLLEHHAAQRLLITGVYPQTKKGELKALLHGGIAFDCCADLGFDAVDTIGNAAEAAEWVEAHGYRSVIVVTARFHMPRAMNEFAAAMPGVRLIPYPVSRASAEPAWRDRLQLFNEYVKYLASTVRRAVIRRAEP